MSLWTRLARTFRRSSHDAEIDEEIAFHLAMRAAQSDDARAARLKFGNPEVVREDTRAAGILVWLDTLARDVRYAVRQLRRNWVVTAAVVGSLVLGITANTTIFTLVNTALLKPLPVADPAQLQLLEWRSAGWPDALCDSHSGNTDGSPSTFLQGSSMSPDVHRRLAATQTAASALIGFSDNQDVIISLRGRGAEQASLQYVSTNYFPALGVTPLVGRSHAAADDKIGAEPAVVISHRLWQRLFGGRKDVIGDPIRINGIAATVVGVAPPQFFGLSVGSWVDLYVPLAARVTLTRSPDDTRPLAEEAKYWWVRQVVRLKPGADPEGTRQVLNQQFRQLVVPEGLTLDPSKVPNLVSLPAVRGFDSIGGNEGEALLVMLLLVSLVLLIVCANVANLLLARAVGRQRESAIRLAIGASRGRLVRQHLVESLLLAFAGGALGLWGAHLLSRGIEVLLRQANGPTLDLALDGRILLYTVAIAVACALLFGLAPAFRAARADVQDSLKAHGRGLTTGHLRLPRLLVGAQMALCLAVLVAAGLLGRSLANIRLTDLGFDREHLLYASVNPWRSGMPASQVDGYVTRLQEELSRIPGVRRVGTIGSRPMSGSSSMTSAHLAGRPYRDDGSDGILLNDLGPGVIETLGLRLVGGRSFEPRDIRQGADAVLVDERFVRRFYPEGNALGQRFGTSREDTTSQVIVGVVSNSRYRSLRDEDLMPTMYRPMLASQDRGSTVHFVIRTAIDSPGLANDVRQAAARINPDVPVTEFSTQSGLVDRLLQTERILTLVSRAFSIVAVALAAVGLGGLLFYAVTRRTNEIGIRMAMGAAPGDVARMVMRDSLWLVAGGAVLGIPATYLLARTLKSQLIGVTSTDPPTTAAALGILLVVALLAAWLPARRAAAIEPTAALREQ